MRKPRIREAGLATALGRVAALGAQDCLHWCSPGRVKALSDTASADTTRALTTFGSLLAEGAPQGSLGTLGWHPAASWLGLVHAPALQDALSSLELDPKARKAFVDRLGLALAESGRSSWGAYSDAVDAALGPAASALSPAAPGALQDLPSEAALWSQSSSALLKGVGLALLGAHRRPGNPPPPGLIARRPHAGLGWLSSALDGLPPHCEGDAEVLLSLLCSLGLAPANLVLKVTEGLRRISGLCAPRCPPPLPAPDRE